MKFFQELTKDYLAYTGEVITAGGAKDGVAQTGEIIDRFGTYTDDDGYEVQFNLCNGKFVVPATATLADTETATYDLYLQTSDVSDFSSDVNYVEADGDLVAAVTTAGTSQLVLTGKTGGTTEKGVLNLNVNMNGCKRYVRLVIKVTLSAASTDTAVMAGVAVLGESQNNVLDSMDIPGVVAE